MPGPSAAVLRNRVTIYKFAGKRDSNGFIADDGTAYQTVLATDVPCSVQPGETETVYDQQDRPTAVRNYKILFGSAYAIGLRDKIVWVDSLGVSRSIIATGPPSDQAGRGYMWTLRGQEKL